MRGAGGWEFSSSSSCFLARIRPSWLTGRKKHFPSTWFLLLLVCFVFISLLVFVVGFVVVVCLLVFVVFVFCCCFFLGGGGGGFAQKSRGIFHSASPTERR